VAAKVSSCSGRTPNSLAQVGFVEELAEFVGGQDAAGRIRAGRHDGIRHRSQPKWSLGLRCRGAYRFATGMIRT